MRFEEDFTDSVLIGRLYCLLFFISCLLYFSLSPSSPPLRPAVHTQVFIHAAPRFKYIFLPSSENFLVDVVPIQIVGVVSSRVPGFRQLYAIIWLGDFWGATAGPASYTEHF